MGKVTKRKLLRNMRGFVAHVGSIDVFRATCEGEELDMTTFVMGMQAMAGYVGTVIEGELPLDDNYGRMLRVLESVALNAWLSRDDGDGEGGDADAE